MLNNHLPIRLAANYSRAGTKPVCKDVDQSCCEKKSILPAPVSCMVSNTIFLMAVNTTFVHILSFCWSTLD